MSRRKSHPTLFILALLAGVAAFNAAPARPHAVGTALAVVGARLVASPDADPVENSAVLIEDGTITAAGARQSVRVPAGATSVDGSGMFVVAGFQNSHVHFTEAHWAEAAGQPADKLVTHLRSMLTKYGFTTVVDTGSFLQNTAALRRRIESKDVPGPRILTAGVPLYPPNGIPYYLKDGSIPPELMKLMPQPATPAEAVSAVDRNIDGGADIIKLFTGSWVARGRVLPMPADVAAAAVREAHRRGRLVFAHTSSVSGLEVTLPAGVDVIAHALDDIRGLTSDHLQGMRRHNVALIPTLTLFGDDPSASRILAEIAEYEKLGGEVLFGTDVGYHTIYDPRREYELLARAGLSWQQVLASLTTNPARRFNESARRGRVAPGMEGDLVVLGSDPRTDARNFADVRFTVRRGEVIYQDSTR